MDSSSAPVFHHVPQPVAAHEFHDAVMATCRPLFPMARQARPRKLMLAISGGVDSMALAFLARRAARMYQPFRVADNPVSAVYGIVIDHRLRQGSTEEADEICRQLSKIGLRTVVKALRWRAHVKEGVDPSQLPNVESVARKLRYQALGHCTSGLESRSLFFAHHRDDQYETVLMRLLSGHGYRGLQGIRDANDVPECYDRHGIYKSGLLDDQLARRPYLSFRPSNKALKKLRSALRDDHEGDPWSQIKSLLDIGRVAERLPGHIDREADSRAPYLKPLNCEDGGLVVYRPLLEFDKDRLRATCEANNIQWFEDHTNHDPTLTTRNAVRHLVRSHELPRALQKPAILAMSDRARRRAKLEEAEAHRLLAREAVVKDFDPNAGTLLVDLPRLLCTHGQARRPFAAARDRARVPHRRLIATIVVRKLIDFVTPDRHLPSLTALNHAVDRLFPGLSPEPDMGPPKAFSIAGVMFDPVEGATTTRWFMSRAPYPSSQSAPVRGTYGRVIWRPGAVVEEPEESMLNQPRPKRSIFRIWDGRFWTLIKSRVPARFNIQPLYAELLGPFRRALPPARRRRLEALLKYYAPGKVRYSLPALYNVEHEPGNPSGPTTLTLLALPSLGIYVPGLERWVKCEVRYRRVDVSLLAQGRRAVERSWLRYRPSCTASRRKRRKRLGRRRTAT